MIPVAAERGATVIRSNHSEYDNAYTQARLVPSKRRGRREIIRSSSAPTVCHS
jgi:hypothetical protein